MMHPATAKPAYDYLPGLDGLRACAVLLVLVAHLGFSHVIPGGFGVTLFFFISGMLITRLLLAEYDKTGTISVQRFYMRRILRLYPALVVAIVLGAGVFWMAGGQFMWGKTLSAIFYYINFYGIYVGFGQGRDGFDPFSILWSLAIEQQFYLLFPLCVLPFLGRQKAFLYALTALIVAVFLWRSYLHFDGASADLIYMRTDTRIDSILFGALLTLVLCMDKAPAWIAFASRPLVLLTSAILIVASFLIRHPDFRDTFRFSLQGLALMPIITAICFSSSNMGLSRLLEIAPLRRIGAWSYSLYLFHPIAIVAAEILWGPGSLGKDRIGTTAYLGFVATALPLTFLLAMGSYYWIEKPFIRWRYKFGSSMIKT